MSLYTLYFSKTVTSNGTQYVQHGATGDPDSLADLGRFRREAKRVYDMMLAEVEAREASLLGEIDSEPGDEPDGHEHRESVPF